MNVILWLCSVAHVRCFIVVDAIRHDDIYRQSSFVCAVPSDFYRIFLEQTSNERKTSCLAIEIGALALLVLE